MLASVNQDLANRPRHHLQRHSLACLVDQRDGWVHTDTKIISDHSGYKIVIDKKGRQVGDESHVAFPFR